MGRFITLKAEMIDENTALVRGLKCQYMIDMDDIGRADHWDSAASRMMSEITRLVNGHQTGGHNKMSRAGWDQQCQTWTGLLRKTPCRPERARDPHQDKRPHATWDNCFVRLRGQCAADHRRATADEWETWAANHNISKRSVKRV